MPPQIYFVTSHELATSTASSKILPAPDDASAVVSAHLVIEALLFSFVRKATIHPDALDSANLRFYQTMCLAHAFRGKREDEDWLWQTIDHLNRIRNRLSHDIHVSSLPERIEQLYAAAGQRIDIHAPGADPVEREGKKLKIFLLILCSVVESLRREPTEGM